MNKITPDTLAEIKARVRLEDLARQAGMKLIRESGQWKTKCPFHDDKTPSLAINGELNGGVYKCHGCGAEGDIFTWTIKLDGLDFTSAVKKHAAAAGVEVKYEQQAAAGERKVVATYNYVDDDDTINQVVKRWEPGKQGRSKDFTQELADGTPKKNPRQILYRLKEVRKAAAAGELVFITEGEKAADALVALGVCATTAAGGAQAKKTWSKDFVAPLARAKVVLWPDHDDVGVSFMEHVADVLAGVAQEVKTLTLGVDKGDDAVEWIAAGGTKGILLALALAAPLAGEDWQGTLRRTKGFEVRGSIDNALLVIEQHEAFRGALYFDVRAYQPFTLKPMPWDDAGVKCPRAVVDDDVVFATRFMATEHDATFAVETVGKALWAVAGRQQRDEIAHYLKNLKWDGVSRIDTWLPRFAGAADNAYTRAVGRAWLISAVARALEPGCQVDHVLVLEGPQGLKKSSLLRALAGAEYFSDQLPDISHKDASLILGRTWIQELAELEAIGKKETPTVRAFLTRRVEVFRPPYGRGVVSVPRRVVFAATTNERNYLRDPAGNRRYWPVLCASCDVDGLIDARDQLWAEATELYSTGEPWYLADTTVLALAKEQQAEREQLDPWEELVEPFLLQQPYVTMTEVFRHLKIEEGRQTPNEAQRLGVVMRHLGWDKKAGRVGGKREKRWYPVGSLDEPQGSTQGSTDDEVRILGSLGSLDSLAGGRAHTGQVQEKAEQLSLAQPNSKDPKDPRIH